MGAEASSSGGGGGRLKRILANGLYRTNVYDLTLGNAEPAAFVAHVNDPWPGRTETANALFQGRYEFAGEKRVALNEPPWDIGGGEGWRAELHGFSWLRHFQAAGGEAARLGGRELIRTWMDRHSKWHALVWRGDVLGRRLAAWSAHAAFLLEGADPTFRRRFLTSFARQAKHLLRDAGATPDGPARIAAILGLVTSALALGGGGRQLARALAILDEELPRQILADGGHVCRNPQDHMAVLADLLYVRAALLDGGAGVPQRLDQAIKRMTPMLKFFRHGDGALAVFGGGNECDKAGIDTVLAAAAKVKPKPADDARPVRSDIPERMPDSAPQTGFERLEAGPTLVLMDAGGSPPAIFAASAHAGPLAFEMSMGRERLIVNCGSHHHTDWRDASRSTAAHSTLTLADTNALELEEAGGIGKRSAKVTCERNEDGGSIWIEAAHDGYAPFGVIHGRRLYLGSGGGLKGEDSLSWQGGKRHAGHAFAVRFHLHPAVQASKTGDGGGVLLRLASGKGFTFHAGGARIGLEESVYLGGGDIRRCEQIVLSGDLAPTGAIVKWAFVPVES